MQIMLVFEIQIFVHQIQPVDFWFNISYSVHFISTRFYLLDLVNNVNKKPYNDAVTSCQSAWPKGNFPYYYAFKSVCGGDQSTLYRILDHIEK